VQYQDPPVRQSAYALLGDLAISAFELLRANLPAIMPELINQIEPEPKPDTVSVCNNATWSAGEIALQYGNITNASNPAPRQELEAWVMPLIQRLIPVLLNPKSVKSLSENAAVTIGRLGLVVPDIVAAHLEIFLGHQGQRRKGQCV
jgi:transportin-1